MSSRVDGRVYRTERCPEMLIPLHSDPARCTLREDFHVVYRANLSHMILYLLPRHVEWKLRKALVSAPFSAEILHADFSIASEGLTHV